MNRRAANGCGLAQQYFFVTCSLQDMLHLLELAHVLVERFAERFAVQLYYTHPSIGVAELMRLLVDERRLDWDVAWTITVASFGYTNHTLLPEALETWPLSMFAELLPRHLEIIYEINRRFLDEVRSRFPGDEARATRMSLIGEEGGKRVRMAHLLLLAVTPSGAALHTELLQTSVLGISMSSAGAFSNKTNGVTPRCFCPVNQVRGITRSWPDNADETQCCKARCHSSDDTFQRTGAELATSSARVLHPKTGITSIRLAV
jgi:starch phosphorylase